MNTANLIITYCIEDMLPEREYKKNHHQKGRSLRD